jgi:Fe/S biogenesis protein NfuA
MLKVTDLAQTKIKEALENYSKPVIGIRAIAQARSPFQISYGLAFVDEESKSENDISLNAGDVIVFMESEQEQYFEEVILDYEDGLAGSGFKFTNLPRVPKKYIGTFAEKVVRVIDEEINPSIASHGGFVSLVDVKDNNVIIQMGGGCQGCGMANVTLKDGIEVALKNAIPEIGEIYDVTEHAEGKNPYYNSSEH